MDVGLMHHMVCQFILVLIAPTHGDGQAQLTCVAGWTPRWFTRPQAVTHFMINWVWHGAITLIETSVLPPSQTANESNRNNNNNNNASSSKVCSVNITAERELLVTARC